MSLRVTARLVSAGRAAMDFSSLCNVGKVRLHFFQSLSFSLFGKNLNAVLVFCYLVYIFTRPLPLNAASAGYHPVYCSALCRGTWWPKGALSNQK